MTNVKDSYDTLRYILDTLWDNQQILSNTMQPCRISIGRCGNGRDTMTKLDYLLRDYKWYRRIKGGTWYLIRLNADGYHRYIWYRSYLKCSERYIMKTEEYK